MLPNNSFNRSLANPTMGYPYYGQNMSTNPLQRNDNYYQEQTQYSMPQQNQYYSGGGVPQQNNQFNGVPQAGSPQSNNNIPTLPNLTSPQNNNGVNFKLVDSQEMVRSIEIPFGGYGIFPRTDFQEIYIKTWNNQGTTDVLVYTPTVIDSPATKENNFQKINSNQQNNEMNNLLFQKISELEKKIDCLLPDNKEVNNIAEDGEKEVVF